MSFFRGGQRVGAAGWVAITSFPAGDGSRTLRKELTREMVEALHNCELRAIRHTYLRSTPSDRVLCKVEVLLGLEEDRNKWMPVSEWKPRAADALRIPVCALSDLKCGKLRSIRQKVVPTDSRFDDGDKGIRSIIEVELATGEKKSIEEYLKKDTPVTEMCVPLSKEEAAALFERRQLIGVRHSFFIGQTPKEGQHVVEVGQQQGPTIITWETLASTHTPVWDKMIEPHFRLIHPASPSSISSSNSLNKRIDYSPVPWLTFSSTQ